MPIAFTDTFIVTDAAGNVTFDFAGHVHAKGLDLDAGTVVSPPSDNRVRWIRTDNGDVVADILGAHTVQDYFLLKGYGTGNVETHVSALNTVDGHEARMRLGVGIPTSVEFDAQAQTRRVIDSNGNSDFARLPGYGNAMFATARFGGGGVPSIVAAVPAGAVAGIVRPGGFPVGVYDITMAIAAPSGAWRGTVSSEGATGNTHAQGITASSATVFRVVILNAATGALADDNFEISIGG